MIRKANISDSYNISNLIVSSWKTAYKGLLDDIFLDNLSIDDINKKWQKSLDNKDNNIYVYEEENKILGVIKFGLPGETSSNYNAEIHVLYVHPSFKRHGIGTKLFNYAVNHFINQNATNMIIWCLKGNTPAIEFYQKMGGTISHQRNFTVNNIEVEEVGLKYNLKFVNIKLRNYIQSDANEIVKWIHSERDLKLWSFNRYPNYPIKPEDINNNYEECKKSTNFYPMTLIDNDKIIGHIVLRNPSLDKKNVIRLGFVIINSELKGKGYGKLLVQKAINYAHSKLLVKEITLGVFDVNQSAYHCYKSIGFKEVEIKKDAFGFQGEMWNYIEMVLK